MPKKKKSARKKSLLQFDISFGSPSLTQKVLFAKNLSVMLRSGMTLVDALYTVQGSLSGSLARTLSHVIEKVESGVPLSRSFASYPRIFPELFVNVTQAGESAGTLPENLENIARQLKKDKDLITKIRTAMVYPSVILVAAVFLGLAIAFFILPDIVPLFEGLGTDLPLTTQGLIVFSDFAQAHGLVLLTSIIGGLIALVWLLRRRFMRPIVHFVLIKLPLIKKIVHYANIARFANTLGTSLKSGMSIDEALTITSRSVSNYYYRKELEHITTRIRAGSQLSDELIRAGTLFPPMLTRMLRVGEASGSSADSLLYIADFYDEEVGTYLKTFTTLLEPLLLLFIGGVVGFFALSIISPIYDITSTVQ